MTVSTCNVVIFIMTSAALVVVVSSSSTPTQVNNCNNFDERLINFIHERLFNRIQKIQTVKYTTFRVCSNLWKSIFFLSHALLYCLTGPRGPPGRDGKTHKTTITLYIYIYIYDFVFLHF